MYVVYFCKFLGTSNDFFLDFVSVACLVWIQDFLQLFLLLLPKINCTQFFSSFFVCVGQHVLIVSAYCFFFFNSDHTMSRLFGQVDKNILVLMDVGSRLNTVTIQVIKVIKMWDFYELLVSNLNMYFLFIKFAFMLSIIRFLLC